MRIVVATIVLLAGSVAAAQTPRSEQDTRTLNLTAYAELLRSDVRTQKVAILTELMEFSDDENTAFWPLYREYETEMARLGDQRVALIAEYAASYSKMTDEIAAKLANAAIELEAQRQAAKARSFERIRKVLAPRTALRFLQIEQQLYLLVDLQISSLLPIVK
jgi:hypothetical protein